MRGVMEPESMMVDTSWGEAAFTLSFPVCQEGKKAERESYDERPNDGGSSSAGVSVIDEAGGVEPEKAGRDGARMGRDPRGARWLPFWCSRGWDLPLGRA